jgi:hypothetical protein
MAGSSVIWTWIAALLTLAVFSFLYKDNIIYKMVEALFVGVSAGYSIVIIIKHSFIPNIWIPLFIEHDLLYLVPFLTGLLFFAMLSRKTAYLTHIPFAFLIGAGAGFSLPLVFETNVMAQIKGTMLFAPSHYPSLGAFLNALVIFIGVLTVLFYFFFSRKQNGKINVFVKTGIAFIMLGFGASFGYTVMARLSLLVGRLYFLFGTWLGILH